MKKKDVKEYFFQPSMKEDDCYDLFYEISRFCSSVFFLSDN